MKRSLLVFPITLLLSLPAAAAPGEEPRQDPPQQQAHKTDYWLSADMQRLAFWQSREPEVQTGRSAATR